MLLLVTAARRLEPVQPPAIADSLEYGEEWEVEIERRIEDVRAGRVELIPAEQVFAELDAKLEERRRERARSNGGR